MDLRILQSYLGQLQLLFLFGASGVLVRAAGEV